MIRGEGQHKDFKAVLREHAGLLSRIAASYEADLALRDDLLQDMAFALWRALPGWRGHAPLRAFVARVAHNRGATHVVGQMRRPTGSALHDDWVEPHHGPEGHAELEERRMHLQDAVRRLPLSLRQAVTLALEGFSHAEIADALGITANSVGVRLNRAKSALKTALGEQA
jgi:RNA polymerase sigma-70 factor (ECF subfamily)